MIESELCFLCLAVIISLEGSPKLFSNSYEISMLIILLISLAIIKLVILLKLMLRV